MKELVKISSLLSVAKIFNIFLSIIRVKVSAIFLQPFGMGIVSQLSSFQNLLERIVDLGIGAGVTKNVAQYKSEKNFKKLNLVLSTSVVGFAFTGILVVLIISTNSSYFSQLILNDKKYYYLIILASLSVVLSVQYKVIERSLQGFLKMKQMVILSLISSVIGVCLAVPLIYYFSVTGAVISFLISNFIVLIIAQAYFHKLILKEHGIKISFNNIDKSTIIDLLKFGGANSTVFLSTTLTLLYIRTIIIRDYGAESNGLYQVAIGTATQYIGIVAIATWQYGMPKVATLLGQSQKIRTLQNDVTSLNLIVLTPLVTLLLLFRNIWIPILFSDKFLSAYTLVGWQLLGEVFRSIKWGPNMVNQPYERYNFIIIQSILNAISFLLLFWFLIPRYGLVGAPMAYAFSQILMTVMALAGHYYYDRFIFSKRNILLIIFSLTLIFATLFITQQEILNSKYYLLAIIMLIIWFFVNVNKIERAKIKEIIKTKTRRR